MSRPSKTTQLLSTSRKKKVVKKKVTKKKVTKKKVSKKSQNEIRTRRPSDVPPDVWGKMGPRQRFNLSSGVLSYDPETGTTYRTDLSAKRGSLRPSNRNSLIRRKIISRSQSSKKVTKKKSVRKKVTKKTRRVDWLKSIRNQKLVMTSGEGSFHFDDGSKYTGQLKNGLFHGHGIRVWEDGTIYTGDWKDGIIHGHGRILYPGGVEYIGSWKNGVKSGRGTLFRKNGTMFSGDWEDGLVKKPLLLRPKFFTELSVSKKKVSKKKVGKKKTPTDRELIAVHQPTRSFLPYPRTEKIHPGQTSKNNIRISVLDLNDHIRERFKKSYIWTLRDLIQYSPMEIVEICEFPEKKGLEVVKGIQKQLSKFGLRLKKDDQTKYVDIRSLSLSERRRLKRPGRKKSVQLDKWGIYTSKKYR